MSVCQRREEEEEDGSDLPTFYHNSLVGRALVSPALWVNSITDPQPRGKLNLYLLLPSKAL